MIVDRTQWSLHAMRSFGNFVLAVTIGALVHGCVHQPAKPQSVQASAPSSPWAAPTSTVQWNEFASELVAQNRTGQFPALRALAYVNVAINNGIVRAAENGVRPEGAAAGAAAGTLVQLFPKNEKAILARLDGEIAALGTAARPGLRGRRGDRPQRRGGCGRDDEVGPGRRRVARGHAERRGQVDESHDAPECAARPAARRRASLLPLDGIGSARAAATAQIAGVHGQLERSAPGLGQSQLRTATVCALLGEPHRCVHRGCMERVRA